MIYKKTNNGLTLILAILLLALLSACTQYKNTIVHRGYHNMTSRYNVYFLAVQSMKEGVDKLEKDNKDDYTRILPIFIYGDNQTCKNISPEMDRTIKKASTCITRHAIKDKKSKQEIIGAVKWIDNAWLEFGKAHFYKREFFTGIETFEYVTHTYTKSKERYEAWLWLVKTFNEMNLLSQSEPYISLIKNDKGFPKEFKDDFEALYAEFYIKQGMYPEAIKHLSEAIDLTRNRTKKARYQFILGQLYEQQRDNKKAIVHYNKALKLKPSYEMVFNVKIKHSLLAEHNAENSKRIKEELLKMTKDIKNSDYLDVIYYTLGQVEERSKSEDAAIAYYKLSTKNSVSNNNQKARSFLRLGDIYFDRTNYTAAEAYYDSTVSLITESFSGYETVLNKKKSLTTLVGHINTIHREDSLQKIAGMDSSSRNKLIDKLIVKAEEDEQKKLDEKENSANNALLDNNGNNPNPVSGGPGTGAWYFYNQQTRSFGINDFVKKWGNNRKLEDNWRRNNKQSLAMDPVGGGDPEQDTALVAAKDSIKKALSSTKSRGFYLKDLPLTKALVDTSNKQIIEAYYALGLIYREQLDNNRKAIEAYETLNSRFPKNKYEASCYYQMYRIYLSEKNQPKADECKSYLLANYPESDYTKIINDPDYASKVGAKKSEVEAYYASTYELYASNKFPDALKHCKEAQVKFGKNDFSPRFAYLKALCIGHTQPLDSLESALRIVVAKYPKDPVYEPAKAMLTLIEKKKNPNAIAPKDTAQLKTTAVQDTFNLNDNSDHYWVIVIPNGKGDINKMENQLSDFHNTYYSTSGMNTMAVPIGFSTLITVKTLKNKTEALAYHNLVLSKSEVFANIQKENCSMFVITSENLVKLIKNKNTEEYKTFFNKNYLGLKQ